MRPLFLEAGYEPDLFWELGFGDVRDCLNVYSDRVRREDEIRKRDAKDLAGMLYVQAAQIANAVAAILPKSQAKMQPLSYFYPDLFREEAEKDAVQTKTGTDLRMEAYEAQMDYYMKRHNARMEKERKDV